MTDRDELGFLLDRLLRTVIRREQPIMERHHLEMWEYVVMSVLARGPAPTQAELATATGRDKTRLIRNLDRLEERGLVSREPDPADRRNKIVSLTQSGDRLLRACRADIWSMEEELLSALKPSERAGFERSLVALSRDAV